MYCSESMKVYLALLFSLLFLFTQTIFSQEESDESEENAEEKESAASSAISGSASSFSLSPSGSIESNPVIAFIRKGGDMSSLQCSWLFSLLFDKDLLDAASKLQNHLTLLLDRNTKLPYRSSNTCQLSFSGSHNNHYRFRSSGSQHCFVYFERIQCSFSPSPFKIRSDRGKWRCCSQRNIERRRETQ